MRQFRNQKPDLIEYNVIRTSKVNCLRNLEKYITYNDDI